MNDDAPTPPKQERSIPMWERHLQTIMLAIMLGVVGFIGSQYVDQKERLSNAEIRITTNAAAIVLLGQRIDKSEERRDREMGEIRAYLQRIEDKIDRKVDK